MIKRKIVFHSIFFFNHLAALVNLFIKLSLNYLPRVLIRQKSKRDEQKDPEKQEK
jgi:hypothetical protein